MELVNELNFNSRVSVISQLAVERNSRFYYSSYVRKFAFLNLWCIKITEYIRKTELDIYLFTSY